MTLEKIMAEAVSKANELLMTKPSSCQKVASIPKTQGVYLIYNKDNKIIYVGKGRILQRRIGSDHISGETTITTSTFRRKLVKTNGLTPGSGLRKWIIDNCSFAWVEIHDKDITSLVEDILIALLRNDIEKAELLND